MIDELIKNATLSRDKVALNAYKNIKAEFEKFKHAQVLERKLTEDVELRIISNYAKKLKEAINQFLEASREDLANEYREELEVVEKLLPAPVSGQEIASFIESDKNFFDEYWRSFHTGDGEETSMRIMIPKKDMGNAIKYLKAQFPTADGKLISEVVKQYLV